MKRRLMSFVLAAVMVMTMLPGMVLESEAASLSALDTALLESNSKMQNVLAVRSVDLNVAALDGKKVKSATQELGFSVLEQDYRASELDEDRAGYTLAKKTIKTNGKEKHVYLLVIRGTYETGEWLSNFFFTVSDAVPAHTGFEGAKTQALKALINHVNADEKENNILWVTGHSRGAAVANLVAATFQDGDKGLFKQDAVHAYTFACPNTTRKPNSALNIYNFNFNEDIVPTVPLSTWGYGRNGKTYTTDYRKWCGNLLISWTALTKDMILSQIKASFPSAKCYSQFVTTMRYQHEKPLIKVFELFGDKKWLMGIDAAQVVVAQVASDAFFLSLIEGVNLLLLDDALVTAATQIDGIVNSHLVQGYQTWIRKAYPFKENTGATATYLSRCSAFTPTLIQVTGKEGNLKALPCSVDTDPGSFAYHELKGRTFVIDGFCTNSEDNLWYRTSCNCGCGAETAYVYSGDVKVDKMLYDAKITGASYPSSLKQGQFFPLEGTITTSHQIKSVTARVKTSNGKTEFSKTDSVSLKQSYTIDSVIDNAMTFNTLSAGSYVYEIEITEQTKNPATGKTESHTQVVLSKNFSVGSSNSTNSSDTLSLSGETYPTSLSVGQWFALKGTVTSSVSNITSLTAGAFDSAGNMKTGNTVSPNSKSYNIVNIDPDVHFDWLPAGTYSYIIRATNASGTKELLNKTFTVGGGSSGSGSTISASGRYSVTNTRNITGQDIVATARQWANEGATYWSHYDPWLPSIYWRTGYTYNGQQSFDCSGFVSRVLNDCGLRSGNYTPPYGDCILSQQYGSGFMSIQIEDLVNYGTDITDAVKRAKNGDYSGLQPGDLIAWTSSSLGRHIIIYAGMKNGTPWTVEFTGNGYRDRAMPAEYQGAFQFGARLVSDAGAACSEHTKGEFLFYEDAHPHYNYYACATCGAKFSDWTTKKLSDCSSCSPIDVDVINCIRTFRFPDRMVPLYDAPADTDSSMSSFPYQTITCDQYAQLSSGKVRYHISDASGDSEVVGKWFSAEVDIKQTGIEHQFGETTYAAQHPHMASKSCQCGHTETWDAGYREVTCQSCNLKRVEYSGPLTDICLSQGDILTLEGRYTSPDKSLISVDIAVLDSNDKTVLEEKIAIIGGNTFDLRSLDGRIAFDTLPVGSYLLIINASNGEHGSTINRTLEITPYATMADVSSKHWYYNAVQYVMKNGIMSGYNATTFGPNDNLSRAMVVQVLYNKEGQPAISGKHKFPDVPSSQWYNNAVTWASQHNVVGGYGDGRFGPDDSVTLEQVAVILWNYSKNPAGTGSLSGINGQYSDWAANALRWCAGKGILNNVPYSNATEKATRAQTAQMLKNYLVAFDPLTVVAEYPCLWKVRIPAGTLTFYSTAVSTHPAYTRKFEKPVETFINGAAVLSDGTTRAFSGAEQNEERWFTIEGGIEVINSSCLLDAPEVHAEEHPHDTTRTCEICGFSLTWPSSNYNDPQCNECLPATTNES